MSTDLQTSRIPNGEVLPAMPKQNELRIVHDDGPLSYLWDTARFDHMYRIAKAMAGASLVPDHLKGKTPEQTAANCFLVVNQALRWGFDPFAVAPETYAIGGKLAYQGKLIAAVVNSRGGLTGRLQYAFGGQGDGRFVKVMGLFKGESVVREIMLTVKEAKTSNKMWTADPDQKLVYSGTIKWARRYCPEVVLGVLTEDDLERIANESPLPPQVAPKSLDDLAQRLGGGNTVDVPVGELEPVATLEADEAEPLDDLEQARLEVSEATSITELNDIESHWKLDAVSEMCRVRAAEIRGSRGGKSQGDLLA